MFKLFPSFFDQPKAMRFSDQEPDEVIELLLRRHWITNVPWLFLTFLSLFIPPVILTFATLPSLSFIANLPIYIIGFGWTMWYLLVAGYFIENFLSWYFDVYIVTNKHLEAMDYINILNSQNIEAQLPDVQSAVAQIKGISASYFNFGNVVIETAASQQDIIFDRVPDPGKVQDRINLMVEEIRRKSTSALS